MKLDERANALSKEDRAYFDNATRPAISQFELIERRKQIQQDLLNNKVGYRHKAALLSIARLNEMATIEPTTDEINEQVKANFVRVAQRYRNEGSDHKAEAILKTAGLNLDDLPPRRNSGIDEREQKAKEEFAMRRDEALAELRRERGMTKAQALALFRGANEDADSPRDSMADSLRKQINREFSFDVNRPI